MLFGASIEKLPSGDFRLRISRRERQWPALAFAIMVCESQDMLFDFLSFRLCSFAGDRALFQTRTSCFLGESHRRWYPEGAMTVPADVRVDEAALLFWLIGSLDFRSSIKGPRLLPCKGAGAADKAKAVAALTGWDCGARDEMVVLPRKTVEAAYDWLRVRGVPGTLISR